MNNNDWIKELKVGDKVILAAWFRPISYFDNQIWQTSSLGKIVYRSKNGNLTVKISNNIKFRFTENGDHIGDCIWNRSPLVQATPENLAMMFCDEASLKLAELFHQAMLEFYLHTIDVKHIETIKDFTLQVQQFLKQIKE